MKILYAVLAAAFLMCTACGSPLPEAFQVSLPASPPYWQEVLGQPQWRLEWYDSGGSWRETTVYGPAPDIAPPPEWPTAVLAWPSWPDKDLPPGVFYPAGAIVPFDVRNGTVVLSWKAGPEAVFYRELARFQNEEAPLRAPHCFDWPRFRSFLQNDAPQEIRSDPWLVDWKDNAERSIKSGFDRRRIKAAPRTEITLAIPCDGPWLGASPFRAAGLWEAGETISLPVGSRPEVFACPGGVLRVSAPVQLWRGF